MENVQLPVCNPSPSAWLVVQHFDPFDMGPLLTCSSSHCPRWERDGRDILRHQEDPGSPPQGEPPAHDLAGGRSSTGPRGRWSGNRHRKRFGEIQGHKWKTVVGSPLLWCGDDTVWRGRREETEHRDGTKDDASYPPPDLKERGKCLRAEKKTNTLHVWKRENLLLFLRIKAMRRAQLLGGTLETTQLSLCGLQILSCCGARVHEVSSKVPPQEGTTEWSSSGRSIPSPPNVPASHECTSGEKTTC